MQGIHFISPSVVRALVVSATLLAGVSWPYNAKAQTSNQQGQHDESIIDTNRSLANGGNGNIHFPHPLGRSDAERIRHIFDLQRKGDFTTAQSETIQISDNLLLGDILAERYINPQYVPKIGQLRLWLKNFASYADAPAILKRFAETAPAGSIIPTDHSLTVLGKNDLQKHLQLVDSNAISTSAFKRNPLLDHTVYERSTMGIQGAQSALSLIQKTPGMTDLYAAQLQAEIAQQLFAIGQDKQALKIAQSAFSLSKGHIGLAGYVAGLISWKQNKNDLAFYLFTKASHASVTSANIRDACFFWAARTRLQDHDTRGYYTWLHRAAAAPHTFYGILSAHILQNAPKDQNIKTTIGNKSTKDQLKPDLFTINQIDINTIEDTDLGKRFFALLQVGQKDRAEIILRQLWMQSNANLAFARSIQLVAKQAGFNDLSDQFNQILQQDREYVTNQSALSIPRLKPRHGYIINPALIYALARLESNFNSKAISNHGARGLMQIMPVTAKYIAKQEDSISINHPTELQNDGVNLQIGQLYLIHLANLYSKKDTNNFPQGGSLLHMLASYNAGPTIISKWMEINPSNQDPLLFIETIPLKETKNYLFKSLTNLWIYSDELGISSPSLETLSHSNWPDFAKEKELADAITIH